MTILAGIYSRTRGQEISEALCESLRSSVSRNPSDEVSTVKHTGCFLAQVDLEIDGQNGIYVSSDGSVSLLSGELLLSQLPPDPRSRKRDLLALHEAWQIGGPDLLQRARGVFCAVQYQPGNHQLRLVSDKLCVRPLYYFVNDKYVIFASALRILENLEEVPKEMDVRAVTEIVALGFPMGTRTPYAKIKLMRAAETIEFNHEQTNSRQYWRWDNISSSPRQESELLSATYDAFQNAVSIRLKQHKDALAFLSGGLDSRCVVGALREFGTKLSTFNFSLPNIQDQVFGAEFARAIDVEHHEISPESVAGWPSFPKMLVNTLQSSGSKSAVGKQAFEVWSGDGGSVGLGHVYVRPNTIDLMRSSNIGAAVEAYLEQEKAHVPRRLFKQDVGVALSGIIARGIEEELSDIHCEDPGRAFHVFLMLNDQRRHLAGHYDDIDLHRVELILPFYDSDFLTTVMQVPLDLCLQHKFYNKWLKLFSKPVWSVAWQSYPGHEQCPIVIDRQVAFQWNLESFKDWNRTRRKDRITKAALMLRDRTFPESVIRRWYVRTATLIHQTGLRDYSYVIDAASTYQNYWRICGGNYVIDSEAPANVS